MCINVLWLGLIKIKNDSFPLSSLPNAIDKNDKTGIVISTPKTLVTFLYIFSVRTISLIKPLSKRFYSEIRVVITYIIHCTIKRSHLQFF